MDIVLKNVKKKDFPVLKSLAKSLGFEISQETEKPYNPEFVAMILKGQEELRQGKGIKMTMNEIRDLCK